MDFPKDNPHSFLPMRLLAQAVSLDADFQRRLKREDLRTKLACKLFELRSPVEVPFDDGWCSHISQHAGDDMVRFQE